MGRPRTNVLVGAGAAVAVLAVVVVATTRDGGGDGGGCVSGLVEHLPEGAQVVNGSDHLRAQAAGIDLGAPLEDLSDQLLETGFQPDPLYFQTVFQFAQDPESVGYEPGDVDCWLGDFRRAFTARGDFDADAVTGAETAEGRDDGELAVADGLLASDPGGEADRLIEGAPPESTALVHLLEGLDRRGSLTFSGVQAGDDPDDPWVGIGLADGDGGDFDLVMVWAYGDADQIEGSDRADIVDAVVDGSVDEMIEGEANDLVQEDGATFWLRAPMAVETRQWVQPQQVFDPAFTAVGDGLDDGD
jgi:hypothetical protein